LIETPGNVTTFASFAIKPRIDSEIVGVHFTDGSEWDIYLARPAPAKLLGAVEAVSERAAIVKAAKEFKQDPAKLIAVRRQ
jgi:hypothetical protein